MNTRKIILSIALIIVGVWGAAILCVAFDEQELDIASLITGVLLACFGFFMLADEL